MKNYGDHSAGQDVLIWVDTNDSDGASVSPTITAGNIKVFKDGTDSGIVVDADEYTEDVVTGVHKILLDVSDHPDIYTVGSDFALILTTSTIDGQTVMATLAIFSIRNRNANSNSIYK